MLNRSIKSILRQPIKFTILFLLVLILSTVVSGAISAVSAINITETNLRQKMRPIVTFTFDGSGWERAYRETAEVPTIMPLTTELLEKISALPQVESHHYAFVSEIDTGFIQYLPEGAFDTTSSTCIWNQNNGECYINLIIDHVNRINFIGTSSIEPFEMMKGLINLTAGRNFDVYQLNSYNSWPVLVSNGFAEINGLMIGSTFSISSSIRHDYNSVDWDNVYLTWDDILFDQMTHNFEIIGLFDVVTLEIYDEQLEPDRRKHLTNRIYTTNEAIGEMQLFEINSQLALSEKTGNELGFNLENWFFDKEISLLLKDPALLEDFKLAVTEYLPEFWNIQDLTGSFEKISSSMSTINQLAEMVIFITILSTVVILSLLILMFLKDRRNEIGIYLALGEKRKKIFFQFLFETLPIALTAITFSIFSGHIISSNLSQSMIWRELTRPPEINQWDDGGGRILIETWYELGYNSNLSYEELLNAFDTSINIHTLILIFLVGFTAIFISTTIPLFFILRLPPKKIFT